MQIKQAMPINKQATRFDVSVAIGLIRAVLDKQEVLQLNN